MSKSTSQTTERAEPTGRSLSVAPNTIPVKVEKKVSTERLLRFIFYPILS